MIRNCRWIFFCICFTAFSGPLFADNGTKVEVNLGYVEELARKAADKPWSPPSADGPAAEVLKKISYDQYREIRFLKDKQIWSVDNLPFRLSPLHLGYLFLNPVQVHEFTNSHSQKIPFTPLFFDYGNSGIKGHELQRDLDYSGLRIHYPLNQPNVFDELCVFQGASYYRMLGREQNYGAAARGLAINTGLDEPEEFPLFTKFWAGKPQADSKQLVLYALLESSSATGAFEFTITPGVETVVNVRQTLFLRNNVKSLGITPLTSMFWFGENTKKLYDDFRPEVHDSDGLALNFETGEFLWRPLESHPSIRRLFTFGANNVRGFGLLQRDRDFRHYQDLEALYHRRPSVWIQPVGDWGEGDIKLVELPTTDEMNDNIVLFWEPKTQPTAKTAYRLAYRQIWTQEPNPGGAGGYTVSTRTGIHQRSPGSRFVKVDFVGSKLSELPPDAQLTATVSVADPRVDVFDAVVQKNPYDNSWRVSFRLKAKEGQTAPLELEARCFIRRGDDVLTETWSSLISL